MRTERWVTQGVIWTTAAFAGAAVYGLLRMHSTDPFFAVLIAIVTALGYAVLIAYRETQFWEVFLPVIPPLKEVMRFTRGVVTSTFLVLCGLTIGAFVAFSSPFVGLLIAAGLGSLGFLAGQAGYFIPSPFIRGTRRLTAKEAEEAADEAREIDDPGLPFGNVLLPTAARNLLFIFIGSPRSGKTTLLEGLLRGFLRDIGKRKGGGTRLILADPKSENLSKMAYLVRNARILNLHPFDDPRASTDRIIRSCAYDIAADTTDLAAAETIAQAILPTPPAAKEPFWYEGAQEVMSRTLWALKLSAGHFTLGDFVRVLQIPRASAHLMRKFQDTRGGLVFQKSGDTGEGILMTAMAKVAQLESVAWAWENGSRLLSLDDFIDGEAVLLLPNHPVAEGSLHAISRVVVTRLGQRILSEQYHAARLKKVTYLMLDETNNIGVIPNLSRLMTQAPGMGGITVLSIHSEGLLKQVYGEASASLRGQAGNIVGLRMSEPETAMVLSKMFGRSEMAIDGHRQEEPVVYESELKALRWADSPLGMEGFFQSAAVGAAWHAEFPPEEMAKLRIPSDPTVPDFVARPAEDFRPREYTADDMKRLGLPEKMLKLFLGKHREQEERSKLFRSKFKTLGEL